MDMSIVDEIYRLRKENEFLREALNRQQPLPDQRIYWKCVTQRISMQEILMFGGSPARFWDDVALEMAHSACREAVTKAMKSHNDGTVTAQIYFLVPQPIDTEHKK